MMDLFEWPQLQDDQTLGLPTQEISDFQTPGCASGPDINWEDYYSSIPFEQSPNDGTLSVPRYSSHSSTTQSSQCTEHTQSPSDTGIDRNENSSAKSRSAGRPRYPLQTGRDSNMNRIQRRRTQNRNSQRIYRQRRMEERNLFESRAIAAEENSRNLETQLAQLHSVIASLEQQVQQLQTENLTLREYR